MSRNQMSFVATAAPSRWAMKERTGSGTTPGASKIRPSLNGDDAPMPPSALVGW